MTTEINLTDLKNATEEIITNFNFYKVQRVMEVLEWNYWDSVGSYPTIKELRDTATDLLTHVGVLVRDNPQDDYIYSETGGFKASFSFGSLFLEFIIISRESPINK